MPKVTEAYKIQKKAVIMDGAWTCFVEKGFQTTTIDDIVEHLGMSKGAIYTYFKSKEDIIKQVMDDRMNGMIQNLNAEFKSTHSAADKLELLFTKFHKQSLDQLRQQLKIFVEFMIYSSRQEELDEFTIQYFAKATDFIKAIIEEGKHSGEFRSDLDSDNAVSLFWGVRDGLALQYLTLGSEEQYKHRVMGMKEMVFRYLKN